MLAKLTLSICMAGLMFAGTPDEAALPSCCVKRAYCCSQKQDCCGKAAVAQLVSAGETTARPSCCAKHAYCCTVQRACCKSNKAMAASSTSPQETLGVAEASNAIAGSSCCMKRAYCCSVKRSCCSSGMNAVPTA